MGQNNKNKILKRLNYIQISEVSEEMQSISYNSFLILILKTHYLFTCSVH